MKKSPIYILEPFLDEEGILQVGGRLKNTPLTEKAQHPIILPKNHHASRLVARHSHEFQSGHSGKEYVLSLIRQKFWIVGARPLVKRVLQECIPCKRLKGRPGVQQMADLPSERVTPDNPPIFLCWCGLFRPLCGEEGPESTETLRLLIHLPYNVSYTHRKA